MNTIECSHQQDCFGNYVSAASDRGGPKYCDAENIQQIPSIDAKLTTENSEKVL
jgi:hypothetical protein